MCCRVAAGNGSSTTGPVALFVYLRKLRNRGRWRWCVAGRRRAERGGSVGLELAAEESRTSRAGARWRIGADASLNLEGTRSDPGTGRAPEHGVVPRLKSRW